MALVYPFLDLEGAAVQAADAEAVCAKIAIMNSNPQPANRSISFECAPIEKAVTELPPTAADHSKAPKEGDPSDPPRSIRLISALQQRIRARRLVRELESTNPLAGSAALESLAAMGRSACSAAPALQRILETARSPQFVRAGYMVLLQISVRPGKSCIAAAVHSDSEVRRLAAGYFADSWEERDGLIAAAARWLADLPPHQRSLELFKLYRSEHAELLALHTAAGCLALLLPAAEDGAHEELAMLHLLVDKEPAIRHCAARALAALPWPSKSAERALIRALLDPEPEIRAAALETLGSRGSSQFCALRAAANEVHAEAEARVWCIERLAQQFGQKALAFFVTLQRCRTAPPEVAQAVNSAIMRVRRCEKPETAL